MNWANKVMVDQLSSDGPALAGHDGHLFIAWTGRGNRQLNVIATADGGGFSNPVTLSEAGIAGPALASFGGRLCMGWTGTDSNGFLNVIAAADGFAFRDKVTLQDVSSAAPALSVDGPLWTAWTGVGNRKLNYFCCVDPPNVPTHTKVVCDDESIAGPAMSGPFLAWTGTDSNAYLNVATKGIGVSAVP